MIKQCSCQSTGPLLRTLKFARQDIQSSLRSVCTAWVQMAQVLQLLGGVASPAWPCGHEEDKDHFS